MDRLPVIAQRSAVGAVAVTGGSELIAEELPMCQGRRTVTFMTQIVRNDEMFCDVL
jgi:hypothetical protein